MNDWTMREDDRPYFRPRRRARAWRIGIAVALVAGLITGYYFYLLQRQGPPVAPPLLGPEPHSTPASPVVRPAAPEPRPPTVRHPLAAPRAPAPLPTLEQSDAMARDSIAGLVGREAFEASVVPNGLVRRIVATVDNLPRPTAARRKMPLERVPGAFAASGSWEELLIGAANFGRYAPFVRIAEATDAGALVQSYVRAYPLFQRAYEELGYPGKYFNDRLIEALDDLIAAPELDAPIRLVRPRVLYEFADPDLERRSAGQKMLMRMGSENASRVKAKLREIRRGLDAAGAPKRSSEQS